MMPKYSDHKEVLKLLTECQEADQDNRARALEAQWFIEKVDGQWEPEWWTQNENKPRYTFDMTSPIVDQVAGELEQADFDIKVKPANSSSTKEVAQLFDGMIRNIENISNAQAVYNHAGRNVVTTGLDGWRIVQEYVDDDSFDQDLVIKPLYNFTERVWFDIGSQTRDRSDARYAFVLQAIPVDDYKKRFPKGSEQGISNDRTKSAYFNKAQTITIGQIYYIKPRERELALLSDGRVIEINPENTSILDELAASGVTVDKQRKRAKNVVYSRLFDAGGWLTKEQETVFSYIPVIPAYGNFKVIEDKTVYRGVVQKLMDPQRVMNYSLSREIEEGALAPRAKYWMSPEQARGHEGKLKSLNTNADPVQFYNPDPAVGNGMPPQQQGGAQVNPGLRTISESMRALMGQTAGLFAANMGDNPGLQSGVAIEKLQNKGDTGTIKYFKAMEIAICQTARILIDALPRVYDTARQVRILKEDGTYDLTTVNQTVVDLQTGRPVVVNDLSQGKYDVTCSAGPAFQNRMQETVQTIIEISQYDPSTLQSSGDILFQNLNAPGMDLIAERKRQQLLMQGLIPASQMTDEEQAQVQQMQQNRQPDAATLIAQAELKKAEADVAKAQTGAQKAQIDYQKASADVGLSSRREDREDQKLIAEIEAREDKHDLEVLKAMQQATSQQMNDMLKAIQTQTQALETIRKAIGADAMVDPAAVEAFSSQSALVRQSQADFSRNI